MYANKVKAFNQGMNDAWADKDQNPQQFKSLDEQKFYSEGYTKALEHMEEYYNQQCLDYQG